MKDGRCDISGLYLLQVDLCLPSSNSYRGTRETPVTLENGGIETGQLLTEGKSENKETREREREREREMNGYLFSVTANQTCN